MTELCEIAYKHKTDKCPQIKHEYTPFYFDLFFSRKYTIKTIFEFGIGYPDVMNVENYNTGASLYMWREFFPNAWVYGADIEPTSMISSDRIATFLCDETKKEEVEETIGKIGKDIDVFIDDGSHRTTNQINLCKYAMPLLRKDVVYIVEDVFNTEKLINGLKEYDCYVPHLINLKHKERLVVVRNKQ